MATLVVVVMEATVVDKLALLPLERAPAGSLKQRIVAARTPTSAPRLRAREPSHAACEAEVGWEVEVVGEKKIRPVETRGESKAANRLSPGSAL